MITLTHTTRLTNRLALGLLVTAAVNPLFADTTVTAGANLAQVINSGADTEFTLGGDVTFSAIVNMNSAAKSDITINGAGHAITRSNGNYFNLTQAGATLTITNATLNTSSTSGISQAMIYAHGSSLVTPTRFTLNLDNTVFDGLRGGYGYNGAAIHAYYGADVTVNGDVTFRNNFTELTDSPSAVSVRGNSQITFTGKTVFENNAIASPGYYGGAITIYENATMIFSNDATFTGNHSTAFGGVFALWYGSSKLVSDAGTRLTFTGNYTSGTGGTAAGTRGQRGGAINIGDGVGTPTGGGAQLSLLGETIFDGNYAWNKNTTGATTAVGGAVSIASGTVTGNGAHAYNAEFGKATFRNNYAGNASASGIGLGGAVFHNGSGSLTFGDGSLFENNAAQTSGGAIYINEGTLNLNGGMTFQGNRHGVTFDANGKPVTTTGTANAIYFGNTGGSTGKLNLAPGTGKTIHFYDGIATRAGTYVTINKTGDGEVVFSGKNADSALLNKTTVTAGTFALKDGVTFGLNTANANNTFTVGSDGTLKGGQGSTLATGTLAINGRLVADIGGLKIQSANNVTFADNAVLAIIINDKLNYGTLDLGGKNITANNGAITLEILADGYIPSSDIQNLDTFTIIDSIATANLDLFKEKTLVIKGAEFELIADGNAIYLQQITAAPIPEPTTYALFGGLMLLGLLAAKRRKR